jgi:hypothetical protein
MRLRRETGDFQINAVMDVSAHKFTANKIRPNLTAQDLIGEIIELKVVGGDDDGANITAPICSVMTRSEGVALFAQTGDSQLIIRYDPVTGSLTVGGSEGENGKDSM